MAAASIKQAERIFGDLKTSQVLFIGAGEMIELCAEHIKNKKPKSITVANRSLDRGLALAKNMKGDACLISELYDRLHEFGRLYSQGIVQNSSRMGMHHIFGVQCSQVNTFFDEAP